MTARPSLLAASSLLLALAGPAPAQDPKPVAPPRPVIVLKTTAITIGYGFLSKFDPEGQLPDITDQQHYVHELTSDRKVRTSVGTGDPGYLHARVYPKALLGMFATEVDAGWEQASAGALIGMTQLGFTTQHAARILKDLRGFPEQIDWLEVHINHNPETDLQGLAASVKVKPVAGTWLAKLTRQLRPHRAGAPKIVAKEPVMAAAFAIDQEGIQEVLAPVLDAAAGIGAKTRKAHEANLALITRGMSLLDGTMSLAGDPFGAGGYQGLSGLRDTAGYAELLHSDVFQKYMGAIENLGIPIETEFTPLAFEHSGVKVAKTVITTEIDTPGRPAGDQVSYMAVAGGLALQTTSRKPEVIKRLIDDALARKIAREPLPAGLLGYMELRFMKVLDAVSPFGNPLAGRKNTPEILRLEFGSQGGTLSGSLRFR